MSEPSEPPEAGLPRGPGPRLVFDLDGTLVDSFEDIRTAINHVVGRLGGSPLDSDAFRVHVGWGARNLIRGCCEAAGLTCDLDDALALFRAAYRRTCVRQTRLYPGIHAVLRELGPDRAAILTNKPRSFSLEILRGLGVHEGIGPVVGGDSLPVRKPDPSTLRFVARLWGHPLEEMVMIGDSPVDVEVAHAAGVPCVAVTWGNHSRADLQAAEPDAIADRSDEILALAGSVCSS